jgi:hypothetical protein
MIQFTFSTPERLRRQGKVDKYLHRAALHGLLPDNVRQRQSKAEFSIAYIWYLSELQELFGRRKLTGLPGHWVDSQQLSRWVLPLIAGSNWRRAVGGKQAVGLRMMWGLFGCTAINTRRRILHR